MKTISYRSAITFTLEGEELLITCEQIHSSISKAATCAHAINQKFGYGWQVYKIVEDGGSAFLQRLREPEEIAEFYEANRRLMERTYQMKVCNEEGSQA